MGNKRWRESAAAAKPARIPPRWPEKDDVGTRMETMTSDANGENRAGIRSPNMLMVAVE